MLTGESEPVSKRPGNAVIAGTINGSGPLDIHLSRLPGANSISDIRGLVDNALGAKPRVQDLADKIAAWFIPTVITIALVVFAVWMAVALRIRDDTAGAAVGTSITYGIAVLAISCPCALGLAVPMVSGTDLVMEFHPHPACLDSHDRADELLNRIWSLLAE